MSSALLLLNVAGAHGPLTVEFQELLMVLLLVMRNRAQSIALGNILTDAAGSAANRRVMRLALMRIQVIDATIVECAG